MKEWIGIFFIILIIGVFGFFSLDEELGTSETTIENVTVSDTYVRHIKTKYTIVSKYYIVIETETGTKELSVQHSDYDKIEPKNEIRVEKTVTQTKWTHDTVIKYELI